MDPNILYYDKGKMSCFLADPYRIIDVVRSCLPRSFNKDSYITTDNMDKYLEKPYQKDMSAT
jgi:hypothetical protein